MGGKMKKIVCDICHKEITPADIHVNFNISIEDKVEQLDLHNICFMYFKRMAEELMKEENHTLNIE